MKLAAIHHVAIIVSDYEKSKDFYVNKLGFAIVRENFRKERNDWKLDLRVGEGADAIELEIFAEPNPPKRVNRPEACGLRHLAFRVEDVEATVAELEQMGILTKVMNLLVCFSQLAFSELCIAARFCHFGIDGIRSFGKILTRIISMLLHIGNGPGHLLQIGNFYFLCILSLIHI